VFREFTRLEEGMREAQGLGLGLSIVDRIARVLRLEIQIESHQGKGTRFSVIAPRGEAQDSVAVADVRRFEQEFIDYLRREHGDMLAGIRETGKLGDDTEATLNSAMVAFKEQFRASGDGGIQPGSDEDDENRDAMDVEDVNQEQIKRQKR